MQTSKPLALKHPLEALLSNCYVVGALLSKPCLYDDRNIFIRPVPVGGVSHRFRPALLA